MDGPNRTEADEKRVLTFRSSKAVGLIVQDRRDETFQGAFLHPEQARKIAAELIAFAERAENEPTLTREQYEEQVEAWFKPKH